VRGTWKDIKSVLHAVQPGNFFARLMRRAMMVLRRTKNLKDSVRKLNMKVGEGRGLLMKVASNTVRAKRTRRLVNAIVEVRPQTNGHHQGIAALKALKAF
jgi:hypothetical protein